MNAFGGLGKVGLDYEHKGKEGGNYEVAAFSAKLKHLATPAIEKDLNSDEELLLNENFADEIAELDELES